MRNRCHWFQVQRDIMEWSAHQIITHGCWIWPLILTINLSFFARNYGSFWVCWWLEICRCSLLSRSNLDWVGERGDLQGLNIASTPTFLDWTFHYYSFGNSRCTPCAHNDGLWYVRGVSKMCRCAGQQLILDDYYNDSYSFITTYVYRYINIYLKTLCLMLCMEFCLLIFMKANVVANQWPWSLRDVFADTASTCSISRHCSPSSQGYSKGFANFGRTSAVN